jgi:hypothetical protein
MLHSLTRGKEWTDHDIESEYRHRPSWLESLAVRRINLRRGVVADCNAFGGTAESREWMSSA